MITFIFVSICFVIVSKYYSVTGPAIHQINTITTPGKKIGIITKKSGSTHYRISTKKKQDTNPTRANYILKTSVFLRFASSVSQCFLTFSTASISASISIFSSCGSQGKEIILVGFVFLSFKFGDKTANINCLVCSHEFLKLSNCLLE